jgi:hypothetical protein
MFASLASTLTVPPAVLAGREGSGVVAVDGVVVEP